MRLHVSALKILVGAMAMCANGKCEGLRADFAAETGPVRDADHYNGETYDARLEKPGWDAPGFADKGWKKAVEIADLPKAALSSPSLMDSSLKRYAQ